MPWLHMCLLIKCKDVICYHRKIKNNSSQVYHFMQLIKASQKQSHICMSACMTLGVPKDLKMSFLLRMIFLLTFLLLFLYSSETLFFVFNMIYYILRCSAGTSKLHR